MAETKSHHRKTPYSWDHNGPGSSNTCETCTVYNKSQWKTTQLRRILVLCEIVHLPVFFPFRHYLSIPSIFSCFAHFHKWFFLSPVYIPRFSFFSAAVYYFPILYFFPFSVLSGPIFCCSPSPVRSTSFTQVLLVNLYQSSFFFLCPYYFPSPFNLFPTFVAVPCPPSH